MFKAVGIDENGIERVFGSGEVVARAVDECEKACIQYLAERPDIERLDIVVPLLMDAGVVDTITRGYTSGRVS